MYNQVIVLTLNYLVPLETILIQNSLLLGRLFLLLMQRKHMQYLIQELLLVLLRNIHWILDHFYLKRMLNTFGGQWMLMLDLSFNGGIASWIGVINGL